MAAGGAGGALLGQGFNDLIMGLAGTYDRSRIEEAAERTPLVVVDLEGVGNEPQLLLGEPERILPQVALARVEHGGRTVRLDVVPEDVGSSGPPWRLSAVKGSSSFQGGDPDGFAR